MSSNPSSQPSSLPTSRPSHILANDQTALPVSFTLFLYAGLAGLLLTFVICIVRVFIRHFYLCNFKPNYNGAESGIEIIREADIEICDAEINHATVVRRASVNSDSYVVSVKGIDCSSFDENNPSTRCCSRSASALSIDSPHVSVMDMNDMSSNSNDRDSTIPRGCCLFNRPNPPAIPVSNGYPITGPTASVMNVMESVAEFPNYGRSFSIFSTRAPLETNTARVMRMETEERILSFIVNNSIRNNRLRVNEGDNRNFISSPADGSNTTYTADIALVPARTATATPHED